MNIKYICEYRTRLPYLTFPAVQAGAWDTVIRLQCKSSWVQGHGRAGHGGSISDPSAHRAKQQTVTGLGCVSGGGGGKTRLGFQELETPC